MGCPEVTAPLSQLPKMATTDHEVMESAERAAYDEALNLALEKYLHN